MTDGERTPVEPSEGTLVGIARSREHARDSDAHVGDDPLLCDVRVMVDGEQAHRVSTLPDFILETDAGPHVLVQPARAELVPRRTIEGRYGELLEDPLAQAVLHVAPGDHVRVELDGAVIPEGTRIHVDGRIESEAGVPIQITASALATGPAAEDQLHEASIARRRAQQEAEAESKSSAEPKPEPPPPPSGLGLGLGLGLSYALGVLAAVAVAASYRASFSARAALLAGLALAATAVFVWRRRRWLPPLEAMGGSASGSGLHWRVSPWITTCVIVVLFGGAVTWFGEASSSTNSTDVFLGNVGPYLLALFPLVLLAGLVWNDHAAMRRAILMLRAKPLAPDATRGAFGAFVGPVDRAIQVTWHYAVTTTESRTERRAEDGTIEVSHSTSTSYTWTRSASQPRRCSLSVGDTTIDLDLDGALFGAERRRLEFPTKTQYLPGGHRTSSSSSETKSFATLIESMEAGDNLLVVGRVDRRGDRTTLAKTGEESLFAFSAPTDARRVLGRQVIAHAVALAALVGLSALGLSIAY